MKLFWVSFALLAFSPFAWAQSEGAVDFSEEGLTEASLEINLETETLPGDGFRWRWENFLFSVRRVFTLTTERKAELDRRRLHQLDRKLTACSELGDTDCVEQVESLIERREATAEEFLEKRQEIRDAHLERFRAWREKREERIKELRETTQERRESLQERREERREAREERRDDRQRNREHLIETRSQRLNNKLHETVQRTEDHEEALRDAIEKD